MAQENKELKSAISDLPINQRIEIADYVLESLNRPDPEVEKAWITEVDRRAKEVDSGEVEMVPGEQAMQRLRAMTRK